MASSSTTVIASAALVLSGCAVGILLGRWTASQPQVASASATGAGPADLAPLLAEIRRSNDALIQAIHERRESQAPAGAPEASASSDSASVRELSAAVEKLSGLIDRRSKIIEKLTADKATWEGPGFPSVGAMLDRVRALRLSGDPKWRQMADGELMDAHALWTLDDVLERYGKPTFSGAGAGGLGLTYSRDAEDGRVEFVRFTTADGRVYSIVCE